MTPLALRAAIEHWPITGSFTISRGTKTTAVTIVATLSDGRTIGRGECVPYTRYGESPEQVLEDILQMASALERGVSRVQLQKMMPRGAARNAIDCALWDFEAKYLGVTAASMAKIELAPVTTAYTLSLASPRDMALAAREVRHFPWLKLKLGGRRDIERLKMVHAAAPGAKLIVDANEAWKPNDLEDLLGACAQNGVAIVEQPLAADDDRLLGEIDSPVPICADESVHDIGDLPHIAELYDAVNIKLDKAGGLTAALAMERRARELGLQVMVGCMVATSLAMAPALLLAQRADYVDLDGPLLLERDRRHGLIYVQSLVEPPSPSLWG